MDKTDHEWFQNSARLSCPKLTHLEYETIIDRLENASTRILIALDEARSLLPTTDESHLKVVYDFWHERRTTRVNWVSQSLFEKVQNGTMPFLPRPNSLARSHFLLSWHWLGKTIETSFAHRTWHQRRERQAPSLRGISKTSGEDDHTKSTDSLDELFPFVVTKDFRLESKEWWASIHVNAQTTFQFRSRRVGVSLLTKSRTASKVVFVFLSQIAS